MAGLLVPEASSAADICLCVSFALQDIKKGATVLDADVTENFFYRPTTRATHQVYEQLLVVLQQQLGDQPDEVLRGAADEVLQVLKEDGVREGERKKNIEGVLGPISQDRFTKLFQLSKNITDFMGADQDRDDAGSCCLGCRM